MASVRKASAYSKRKVVPYTRVSRKKGKSYIKTVPPQKIDKFEMGSGKEENLKHKLRIVSDEKCQIRDTALEACRQYINKKLEKELTGNYKLKVVVFPHHIQRENKMLTGAGADRMQTGMQLAFGRSTSKAAIVNKGKDVFIVRLPTPKSVIFARNIIKKIKSKLPCKIKILYEEGK